MAMNFRVFLAVCSVSPIPLFAEEPHKRPAKGIQDNSFLVEESYNQEAGVVQHIFNLRYDMNKRRGPDDREWHFVFTQEWPVFSQAHQFSYQLPYSWLKSGRDKANGLGDVQLNYRYQALYESETLPAFAPRLSLILPTGDEKKGLGDDTLGYQVNLPLSKIVHERVTLHANAGMTLFPDLNGRDPVSFTLAGSAIYAVTPTFNLMLEAVGEWAQSVDGRGRLDHEFLAVISPGARYAFNFSAGQLVLGLAAPIALNRAAPDYGALFYLSWEHRFLREK
jgi:hypothetical protein